MSAVKIQFVPGDLVAERYEVLKVLGRGGMGMVYLVNDREMQQQLALKTLLPQYITNKRALERFAREISALRQLDHPAVVKIYEARRIESLLFYTMDYVNGKTVREWLKQRGKLGWGSTVRILALLADALEHAHRFTIHRDISPENVMVLADGSIRLLDFGLAKLSDVQTAFTLIGVKLGKKYYNAPEQRLNAAGVDHRADIYPLGVMFFELLTGRLPEPDDRVTELVPELPPEAEAFWRKAMAESPEERFATAREFGQELLRIYNLSQRKEEMVSGDCAGAAVAGSRDGGRTIRRLVSRLGKCVEWGRRKAARLFRRSGET